MTRSLSSGSCPLVRRGDSRSSPILAGKPHWRRRPVSHRRLLMRCWRSARAWWGSIRCSSVSRSIRATRSRVGPKWSTSRHTTRLWRADQMQDLATVLAWAKAQPDVREVSVIAQDLSGPQVMLARPALSGLARTVVDLSGLPDRGRFGLLAGGNRPSRNVPVRRLQGGRRSDGPCSALDLTEPLRRLMQRGRRRPIALSEAGHVLKLEPRDPGPEQLAAMDRSRRMSCQRRSLNRTNRNVPTSASRATVFAGHEAMCSASLTRAQALSVKCKRDYERRREGATTTSPTGDTRWTINSTI